MWREERTWTFESVSSIASKGHLKNNHANRIGYADGSFGVSMELSAIAAAVLGGCHLGGGRISLIGTFLGAFMLCGIQSFLILLGVQPQWYILILGLILVLASLADRTLTRLALKK